MANSINTTINRKIADTACDYAHETAAEIFDGDARDGAYELLDLIQDLTDLYYEAMADVCDSWEIDYEWNDDAFEITGRIPSMIDPLALAADSFQDAVKQEYGIR